MKAYTSKEINEIAKVNEDKKANILLNWIDDEVTLRFYFNNNTQPLEPIWDYMDGKLIFVSKYDYIVQFQSQNTVSILSKHAVSWIDRV